MFHHLRSSSSRNRDAQALRHVDPLHVHAPACKVAHGLHNRNQVLGEIRSQNRSYSGNLMILVKVSKISLFVEGWDSQKSTESILCTVSSGLTITHLAYVLYGNELYQNRSKRSPKVSCSANLSYTSEMWAHVRKADSAKVH